MRKIGFSDRANAENRKRYIKKNWNQELLPGLYVVKLYGFDVTIATTKSQDVALTSAYKRSQYNETWNPSYIPFTGECTRAYTVDFFFYFFFFFFFLKRIKWSRVNTFKCHVIYDIYINMILSRSFSPLFFLLAWQPEEKWSIPYMKLKSQRLT